MDKRRDTGIPGDALYNNLNNFKLEKLAVIRGSRKSRDYLLDFLKEQDLLHAKHPFPFMSLPPELRGMVYGYTCLEEEWYSHDELPALTRVSSQVRKECLPVLFNSHCISIFTIDNQETPKPEVLPTQYRLHIESVELLQRLSPHKDLIREVTIDLSLYPANRVGQHPDGSVELTFQRNINSTPQYSVLCNGSGDVFDVDLLEHFSRGKRLQRILRHFQRVLRHFKNCARTILKEHQESFEFSEGSINDFIKKLPWVLKPMKRNIPDDIV